MRYQLQLVQPKIFKITLLLTVVTLLFACNTDELEKKIADLEADKIEAESSLDGKGELIVDFMSSMNEIQANLSTIKERENIIAARFDKGNMEMNNSMKDDIIGDIDLINNLLIDNKEKMADLQSKFRRSTKESNLKIAELETMIENLVKQMELKDSEIATLHSQLAEANKQLVVMFDEYNNRLEELGNKEDVLNTAYYCYGSSKELKAQGVISKKGGFIGIGKTAQLSEDFNKDYFTQIDISLIKEIDIAADEVKLITNHPTESYRIEGEDGMLKLVIIDSEYFWASSKYLVIEVD
tara:strand:- start:841 stop:1731 length:891 start_codon:yes stop_codon:yes gene_type:complete